MKLIINRYGGVAWSDRMVELRYGPFIIRYSPSFVWMG